MTENEGAVLKQFRLELRRGRELLLALALLGGVGVYVATQIIQPASRLTTLEHTHVEDIHRLDSRVDPVTLKLDVVLALLCSNVTRTQLTYPNVRTECRATGIQP